MTARKQEPRFLKQRISNSPSGLFLIPIECVNFFSIIRIKPPPTLLNHLDWNCSVQVNSNNCFNFFNIACMNDVMELVPEMERRRLHLWMSKSAKFIILLVKGHQVDHRSRPRSRPTTVFLCCGGGFGKEIEIVISY